MLPHRNPPKVCIRGLSVQIRVIRGDKNLRVSHVSSRILSLSFIISYSACVADPWNVYKIRPKLLVGCDNASNIAFF